MPTFDFAWLHLNITGEWIAYGNNDCEIIYTILDKTQLIDDQIFMLLVLKMEFQETVLKMMIVAAAKW